MPERSAGGLLGIFGGTFDPVHYGHLRLAEEAADRLGLARVRWIPAGQPTARERPLAGAAQRLAMVAQAIAGNARFELDSAEVDADRPSYTVPTLERLRTDLGPRQPLVLLVGADAFAAMASWHRWTSVFELAHVGIAHRPGFPVDAARLSSELATIFRQRRCDDAAQLAALPAGRIVSFAMTQLDISATRIRTLLSKGESARYLLPDALLEHIRLHHLYPQT